jgi:hypothetical protein
LLAGLAGALLLACTATGCVTVHAAGTLVPSATKAAARQALNRFVTITNQANTKLDDRLDAQAETGALGALDGAGIIERRAASPNGDPHYAKLALHDSRFLIPKLRTWPKWFVVDTGQNRDAKRWLLLFTHDSAQQPWRASYLLPVPAALDPRFATDQAGYVLPVPDDDSGLAVPPGRLGTEYAAYLQHGPQGSTAFADGPATSQTRADRRRNQAKNGASAVTAYADEAADPAHYPTAALRLRDGGALAFFTTQFQVKTTVAKGPVNVTNAAVRALLTGTPNTSITLYEISEQAVTVPPSGKVTFLVQLDSVVDARGQ